jgi:guanylate kinase
MHTNNSVPHDGTMILVISGASGSGKGTTVARLQQELGDTVHFSVSATTRAPRPGEINGVHYYFIDEPTFKRYIEEERFLEWAEVHGKYYGTLKSSVFDEVDKGKLVILDIDVQGVEQVRPHLPNAAYVFLYTDIMELRRRLLRRDGHSLALDRRVRSSSGETQRARTLLSPRSILETVTTQPEEDGIQHITDTVLYDLAQHAMRNWRSCPLPFLAPTTDRLRMFV